MYPLLKISRFHGSRKWEFYWPVKFNHLVSTQPVIGSTWNFMRWLILSHILRKSKTELDSTTHVFKRTTFWLSTFSWKIKKPYHKLYTSLESSRRANGCQIFQKLYFGNVRFRKSNFIFTISSPCLYSIHYQFQS